MIRWTLVFTAIGALPTLAVALLTRGEMVSAIVVAVCGLVGAKVATRYQKRATANG